MSSVLEHVDNKYLWNEWMNNSDSITLLQHALFVSIKAAWPARGTTSWSDGPEASQDPCSFPTLQSTWSVMVSIKFPPTARYSSTLSFSSFLWLALAASRHLVFVFKTVITVTTETNYLARTTSIFRMPRILNWWDVIRNWQGAMEIMLVIFISLLPLAHLPMAELVNTGIFS